MAKKKKLSEAEKEKFLCEKLIELRKKAKEYQEITEKLQNLDEKFDRGEIPKKEYEKLKKIREERALESLEKLRADFAMKRGYEYHPLSDFQNLKKKMKRQDELVKKYAKGEITKKEFEEMKKDLEV